MKGRHIHMAYEKSVTKRKGASISVQRREQMVRWIGDALLRRAKQIAESPEEITYSDAAEHLEYAVERIQDDVSKSAVRIAVDYVGGYEELASLVPHPRDVHDVTRGEPRTKLRDLVFMFLDDADTYEITEKAKLAYKRKREYADKQRNEVWYLHPWEQVRSWNYKSEKQVRLPETLAEQLQDALSDYTAYVMVATTEEKLTEIAKQVGAHKFEV